jgi:signal transduction histidine kinase
MAKPPLRFARSALVAIGSIVIATLLRAAIHVVLNEPIQYTTFYLAVMVTALYAGLYWGLASTLLAAAAATFSVPSLGQTFIPEPSDFAELSLFLVTSTLIVWMSHRMREHRHQAEAAAEERHRLLVAEQAARREADRLNHAKDDFLAAVSHELRTPLQSILGWTQMLREFNLDAEESELATASIERSVRVQSQLINDLLDLSRVVMGKLRLDPRPLVLADVVQAAVQTVYPAAQAKHVHVEVECDGPGPVFGDADRLQQVVWNLLSNAIKFTPAGGTVRVAVSQDGESVMLSVSDTGEGIDAESLPHVFERFHQAENGRRRDGLGLGLAIVKELVELHGGTIRVQSAGKGQGATFRATLPKFDATQDELAAADASGNVPEALRHVKPVPTPNSLRNIARRAVCSPGDHV